MPTYEYFCSKCEQRIEVFQSIKEDPFTVCPKEKCARDSWGKGKVKRLIGTGAGLLFKGSGFYITDYRSENYKAAAKKESEAKSTGSGGGDSQSSSTGAGAKTDSGSGSGSKSESKPAKSDSGGTGSS